MYQILLSIWRSKVNKEAGLKSIYELRNYKFVIESYQRGYRWDSKQVTELLEDLLEFQKTGNNLYCLQPVSYTHLTLPTT